MWWMLCTGFGEKWYNLRQSILRTHSRDLQVRTAPGSLRPFSLDIEEAPFVKGFDKILEISAAVVSFVFEHLYLVLLDCPVGDLVLLIRIPKFQLLFCAHRSVEPGTLTRSRMLLIDGMINRIY